MKIKHEDFAVNYTLFNSETQADALARMSAWCEEHNVDVVNIESIYPSDSEILRLFRVWYREG